MTHLHNTSNQTFQNAASGESITNQAITLISREIISRFCATSLDTARSYFYRPAVCDDFLYATTGTILLRAPVAACEPDAAEWGAGNVTAARKLAGAPFFNQPLHAELTALTLPANPLDFNQDAADVHGYWVDPTLLSLAVVVTGLNVRVSQTARAEEEGDAPLLLYGNGCTVAIMGIAAIGEGLVWDALMGVEKRVGGAV